MKPETQPALPRLTPLFTTDDEREFWESVYLQEFRDTPHAGSVVAADRALQALRDRTQ
jgi:hypothetical protein